MNSQNKQIEAEFFSKLAEVENLSFLSWGSKEFERALKGFQKIDVHNTQRLLDLGCGNGAFTSKLMALGFNIVGLDISHSLLKLNKCSNPDASFVCGDAENLPFGNAQFDLMVVTFLLHHFRRHNELMSEINRVLKVSGTLFVIEPNGWNPVTWWRHNTKRGRQKCNDSPNEKVFSPLYLRKLLTPNFDILEFKSINFDIVTIPERVETFLEKMFPLSMLGGTVVVHAKKKAST